VKDASSLHCLAAVNYYQVGTRTVVLWLSTTLKAPPVDSRNVTWQGKQFMKSNMKRQESNEILFLLDETIYSLKPFWDRVMKDAGQTRYGKLSDSGDLLQKMRKEFIEIVDEMASDSVTDQKHYDEVQQVLKANYAAHVHYSSSDLSSDSDSEPNFPHAKDEEEMTDGDQKAAAIEKTTNRKEAAKALPHAKDEEEMTDGDQKVPAIATLFEDLLQSG
jgi:hypothetical protein